MKIILVLLLGVQVNAGVKEWWQSFCERHLVADDPYQFEQVPTITLVRLYLREGALINFGAGNPKVLRIMGNELRVRTPDPDVIELLNKYERFER